MYVWVNIHVWCGVVWCGVVWCGVDGLVGDLPSNNGIDNNCFEQLLLLTIIVNNNYCSESITITIQTR